MVQLGVRLGIQMMAQAAVLGNQTPNVRDLLVVRDGKNGLVYGFS